jgi:phosphatidylserine/phosphatidylglycerophosphate/cardiolipin synthase-like enzyme
MTTVQISDELHTAARREAERRGVEVDVIVAEAVQRFVVGSDPGAIRSHAPPFSRANPDAHRADCQLWREPDGTSGLVKLSH